MMMRGGYTQRPLAFHTFFSVCVLWFVFNARYIYAYTTSIYTHHYIYMNCYVCVDAICVL